MSGGKLAKEKALFAKNKWNIADRLSSGCYALNEPGEYPFLGGIGKFLSDDITERYVSPVQCHSTYTLEMNCHKMPIMKKVSFSLKCIRLIYRYTL